MFSFNFLQSKDIVEYILSNRQLNLVTPSIYKAKSCTKSTESELSVNL